MTIRRLQELGRQGRRLRAALASLIFLSACGGGEDVVAPAEPTAAVPGQAQSAAQFDRDYRVSIGDKIYIRIAGQQSLSGAVPVSDNGTISHPRLGTFQSIGLSVADLETVIADRLKEAKIENTVVEVSILNLRAIYVIGEVNQSGEYPYFEGLRIKEAIAEAGGYTYRADETRVFVTRYSQSGEAEATVTAVALPGDIIRVPQRYF